MREGAGVPPLTVRAADMNRERFRVDPDIPISTGGDIRKAAADGFSKGGRDAAMGLLLGPLQERARCFEGAFEVFEPVAVTAGCLEFLFSFGEARESPLALADTTEGNGKVTRGLAQFLLQSGDQIGEVGLRNHQCANVLKSKLGSHLFGFLCSGIGLSFELLDGQPAEG